MVSKIAKPRSARTQAGFVLSITLGGNKRD